MNFQPTPRLSSETWVILCVALANVVFHLVLPEYGYHRDEMYYVAIADGFSFANLDMPPGAPIYLKLFLMVFGHSLKVVHLAASVCGSLVIIFACLIAKEFGGKSYALLLTGICLMLSGLSIFGSLYTYDDLSFVVWAGVFYLIVRMINGGDQKLWLAAGVLLGIGMMTKLSILFLGLAIFVSLWFVKERRWFARPWIWAAAAFAVLCVIPYALWQKAYGWYFLSYASTYAQRTTHSSPVLDFIWNQLLPNNVALAPVWLIGIWCLLFSRAWSKYRFFGIVYLVLCVSIFWVGGQFYFIFPIYAVLAAAGAVWLERRLEKRAPLDRPRTVARIAVPVGYVLFAAISLPFFVPLLPVDMLIAYLEPVGVTAGIKTEDSRITNLPQHVADRFGWEEMARLAGDVYREEAGDSGGVLGVAANNWGEASALHVYRDAAGLPEPLCGDGWFYFEAMRKNAFPRRYVVVGGPSDRLRSLFRRVERRRIFTNPHCRPNEDSLRIWYCAEPKVDMGNYWRVERSMDPRFTDTLRTAGVAGAVAYYYRVRRENPALLLFSERQMNALGYRYLADGNVKDAITLFTLNVEAYPESFNVYDSLGEALMADHQYGPAITNYERSIEINPGNDNGRHKLQELKKLAGS